MGENKFSKYLLYAIGEIILVVIGILIALQINNWNTTRLERAEELQVLKSLKTDFDETNANLDETLEKQKRVVSYCRKLIDVMQENKNNMQLDSLGEYIYRGAFSYWRIEPVNGTYDAMIGSGKIRIINNQKLVQLLAKFSAEVKFGFEDETMAVNLTTLLVDKASQYSSKLFPKSLHEYINWKKQEVDENERLKIIEQHLNNDSFQGNLIMKYGLELNRLDYQNAVKDLTNSIIFELNKELKEQ